MTFITSEFFEKYALYQNFETDAPPQLISGGINTNTIMPSIHKYCPKCREDNTFMGILKIVSANRHHDQPKPGSSNPSELAGRLGLIESKCASCQDYHEFFLVYFDFNLKYVKKVGQFPPQSIKIEKNLAKLLGENKEIYQNGLICERNGYGIGAYAYYRRIVENVIENLLNKLIDIIPEEEKDENEKKIKDIQSSHITQNKIQLVKDLLPKKLSPGGLNPLGILYKTLSKGIHSMSEEECLEYAQEIRESLSFLVEQIELANNAKESEIKFTKIMQKFQKKPK